VSFVVVSVAAGFTIAILFGCSSGRRFGLTNLQTGSSVLFPGGRSLMCLR
jgi:hypothetical protein